MQGGGAEKQLCHLVKAQVKNGMEVHVIILKRGVNYDFLNTTGARVHELLVKSNYSFSIYTLLKQLIKNEEPDIVQCWQRPMVFFGSLAAYLSKTPYLLVERANPFKHIFSIKGLIQIIATMFSAGLIANSDVGTNFWKRFFKSKKYIIHIPNIIPVDEIKNSSPKSNFDNYIISVGRLSKDKNYEILIKAYAKSNIKTHSLLIIGEGPNKEVLKKLILKENLSSSVKLLGYRKDVLQFLKGADLFVSLSKHEGMPNVVLEAMVCGLPMILSDIPEHKNLFSSIDVAYCKYNDLNKISKLLMKLTQSPLKKINYQIENFYSEKTVAKNYTNFYTKILSNSKKN